MIERQHEAYGWESQFLAANQNAFAEAGSIRIAAADAVPFVADGAGTAAAFAARVASVRRR